MKRFVKLTIKGDKERIVGYYDEELNSFFAKRGPEHFMRMFQGYGMSVALLDHLESKGIDNVMILYLGKKSAKLLKATVKEFQDSDKSFNFNGNDLQKFISEKDMLEVTDVNKEEVQKTLESV